MNVAGWLRKSPRPVVVMADDKRIEVSRNPRSWKELGETIASLDPAKLTALDGQGNVIRSIVLEESEAEAERAPTSREMTDLQLFAKLLSEAYEKGQRGNQPIVENAMAFVERQGQRLAKAESEIDRLRAHIHKLNLQIAELSGAAAPAAADDSLLGTIVAGAMQAAAGGSLAVLDPSKPKATVKK